MKMLKAIIVTVCFYAVILFVLVKTPVDCGFWTGVRMFYGITDNCGK